MIYDEVTRVAALAAAAGAEIALSRQRDPGDISEKDGPRDLVSEADVETERAIRSIIATERPGDAVLGEEHGHTDGDDTHTIEWLVDPIDGTTSYLYGRSDWAVSVAARTSDGHLISGVVAEPSHARVTIATHEKGAWVDGQVANVTSNTSLSRALVEVNFGTPDQRPRGGEMVSILLDRVRDIRRGGSAAAALAKVAAGRADAVWSPGLQPWDGAAGVLLVLEAGGVVGDLDGPTGDQWPASGNVLAAPPGLWGPLRDLLAAVYSA
jgi:myo-inositol-1(or 4)-monophosphatase